MAKDKKKMTDQELQQAREQFESTLTDFYYGENGLGMVDAYRSPKKRPEDMTSRFVGEDGTAIYGVNELFDAVSGGKPVFAYKNGGTEPFKIEFDDGKLSLGKGLHHLGPKPKAPGFLNRFLGFFGNKKAKEVCRTYDQYVLDEKYQKTFSAESVIDLRAANAETERRNKELADAPKTHEAQKAKIHQEIKAAADKNDFAYFQSPNRWECVSFDQFCIEVAREYKMADPGLSSFQREELRDETFEGKDGFDKKQEFLNTGKIIIKNCVENNQANIFEAMVGKFVTGKTTDLEKRDLKDFFELSYVDDAYRNEQHYPGVNFDFTANPKTYNEEGVFLFNQNAQKMFETPDPSTKFRLNDTKAMLAICSHKMTFGNLLKNSQDTSLGKLGKELNDYQYIHKHIAGMEPGSRISLNENELKTVAHVHLIKQGLKKQTEPGENEVQKLFFETRINNKDQLNTGFRNKAAVTGMDVIDKSIEKYYFKNVLEPNGIKPYEKVDAEKLAHFLGDKSNYKLVSLSLKEGMTKEFSKYEVNTNMKTFDVKKKSAPEAAAEKPVVMQGP